MKQRFFVPRRLRRVLDPINERTGSRRLIRPLKSLLALAILADLAILVPAAPALAASNVSTTVLLTQSNWYWNGQATNIGSSGVSPPSSLADPSVPTGDLAVAGPEQNGQPGKETYLQFDVSAIPTGSTITTFTIKLPVDSSGVNFTAPGSVAPIIACTAAGSWSGGAGAESFAGKPKDNCATTAPKVTTPDSGKTYTADIASIAQTWVQPGGSNFGVAITDDPQNTTTAYQAVFGPAASIAQLTASVTYSPPASDSSSAAVMPDGTGGGLGSGVNPSSDTSSNYTPNYGSGDGLSSPLTTPTTSSPSPTVPPPSAVEAIPTARAVPIRPTSPAPPFGFWLAAILLILLLLAAGIVLGDLPTASVVKETRVARVLADRRKALAFSSARPVRPLTQEA